MRIRDKIQQK